MSSSTTPEKRQTTASTTSSPHCANIKICHTVTVKRGSFHSAGYHDLVATAVFMISIVNNGFLILFRLLSIL